MALKQFQTGSGSPWWIAHETVLGCRAAEQRICLNGRPNLVWNWERGHINKVNTRRARGTATSNVGFSSGSRRIAIVREPFHSQKIYNMFWKAEDKTFKGMVSDFKYLQYYGQDGSFRELWRKLTFLQDQDLWRNYSITLGALEWRVVRTCERPWETLRRVWWGKLMTRKSSCQESFPLESSSWRISNRWNHHYEHFYHARIWKKTF